MSANPPGNQLAVSEAEAQLREQLAAERAGRESAERFAGAALNRGPVAAPVEPQPDPFDRYTQESLKLDPNEQKQLLDRGTRARIREELTPIVERIGVSFQRARQEDAYNAAMDGALDRNPEMAKAPDKLAAAGAAVEWELRQKRQNVSPGEYVRRTVSKFREMFDANRSAAPAPDFVEGVTSPGLHAQPMGKAAAAPAEEKQPSQYQEWYGEDASDVKPFGKDAQKELATLTENYADERNIYLESKGARTFIPKIAQKLIRRRRAAAAAKAAAQ